MAWPPDVTGAESPLYEMLRLMARRPGMYLGERPLDAFPHWLDGYRAALGVARRSDPVLDALDRGDLGAFIAARLDLPNRFAGEGPVKMIAYVSAGGGPGAFADFLLHLDAFLEAEGVARPGPAIGTGILDARRGRRQDG